MTSLDRQIIDAENAVASAFHRRNTQAVHHALRHLKHLRNKRLAREARAAKRSRAIAAVLAWLGPLGRIAATFAYFALAAALYAIASPAEAQTTTPVHLVASGPTPFEIVMFVSLLSTLGLLALAVWTGGRDLNEDDFDF